MGGRCLRRDLRDEQPRDRRGARRLPEVERRGRRPRGRGGEGGLRGVAARPGAAPRRDPLPLRRAAGRAQGRGRRADGARDGQGAARGRRRRPGSDRHELLHGRRGSAPPWPDDPQRAARQVQHERAPADRRGRRDHALELPDRDPVLEDRARARLRQHDRLQAGHRHAAAGRALRRAARRGRCPGRRDQRRARRRRRGRRPARAPPGRAGDHAHRLARDRRRGARGRGPEPEARPPRARRQERDHRARRRRSRPGRRGHRLVGVRHVRPALHRGLARDRAGGRLRGAAEAPRRLRGEAAPRPRLGGGGRRRPGDQQARAREDSFVHRDRRGRGREAAHRRRGRERQRPRATGASTARPSSATSTRRCASPRRRSSARRPR